MMKAVVSVRYLVVELKHRQVQLVGEKRPCFFAYRRLPVKKGLSYLSIIPIQCHFLSLSLVVRVLCFPSHLVDSWLLQLVACQGLAATSTFDFDWLKRDEQFTDSKVVLYRRLKEK